jgi:hypothetical protein
LGQAKWPNPLKLLEAATGFEPVNNGFADRRLTTWLCRHKDIKMERETGFEPATSTLARLHSTAELFPLNLNYMNKFTRRSRDCQGSFIKVCRVKVGGFKQKRKNPKAQGFKGLLTDYRERSEKHLTKPLI